MSNVVAPILNQLSELSDVTLGTLAGGNVLSYDGAKWVNIAPAVTAPGGASGTLQYNNGGAFAGAAGSSVDGSGNIGVTGSLTLSGTDGSGDFLRCVRISDGAVGVRILSPFGLQVRNNLIVGGTSSAADDGNQRIWLYSGPAGKILMAINAIRLASDIPLIWESGTAISGAGDAGFARAATGVIRVTDGGSGFGCLSAKFRSYLSTTLPTPGNAGLAAWVSDTNKPAWDTGAAWQYADGSAV